MLLPPFFPIALAEILVIEPFVCYFDVVLCFEFGFQRAAEIPFQQSAQVGCGRGAMQQAVCVGVFCGPVEFLMVEPNH